MKKEYRMPCYKLYWHQKYFPLHKNVIGQCHCTKVVLGYQDQHNIFWKKVTCKILCLIHQNFKQQIRHISTDYVLFLAVCSYVHRLKNASSSLNEDGNSSYYSFIFALHCVNVFMSTAPWKNCLQMSILGVFVKPF